MTHRDQEALASAFRELRKDENQRAPDFEDMWSSARAAASALEPTPSSGLHARPRFDLRPAWIGAGALAAAAVAALLLTWPGAEDRAFEIAVQAYSHEGGVGRWSAPTDGLLAVPGIEFVTTLPDLRTTPRPAGSPQEGEEGASPGSPRDRS